MTRLINFLPFESAELETSSNFNVVIAYEDLETGKQAKKTYDFLVDNLGHDCQFSNQMWKFEVLSIPKLREMAAKDAAMADIVMIACHGNELSEDVKAWMELWLAEPNHPIALVALFEPNHGQSTREVRSYLAQVAKRGQMELFAQPDPAPLGMQSDFAFPRAINFDKAPFAIVSGVQRNLSTHHWGINE